MKSIKICLITHMLNNDGIDAQIFQCESINDICKTLDIVPNYVYNNAYIIEDCDIVMYGANYKKQLKQVRSKDFFKNSKNKNALFLYSQWSEPHTYDYIDRNDPFNNFVNSTETYTYYESKKSYSITCLDTTEYNLQCEYGLNIGCLEQLYYYYNNPINHKIKKNKFCSSVFSNKTIVRSNFLDYMLNNYKKIDNYGGYGITDNELENIIPHYKFYMCFENVFSLPNEGYITEKIYNAYKYGCIPIYWGNNRQIYDIFNKDSFINLTGLSLKESLEIIKEYDNNDKLYYDTLNTYPFVCDPIKFVKKFNDNKYNFLKKIILKAYNNKYK